MDLGHARGQPLHHLFSGEGEEADLDHVERYLSIAHFSETLLKVARDWNGGVELFILHINKMRCAMGGVTVDGIDLTNNNFIE